MLVGHGGAAQRGLQHLIRRGLDLLVLLRRVATYQLGWSYSVNVENQPSSESTAAWVNLHVQSEPTSRWITIACLASHEHE